MTVVTLGGPGPRPTHPPKAENRTDSARARRRRRRRFSSLTLRILAPNVLALAILVAGVFYLDQYRGGLIDAKIVALQTQAEVIAGALGESALTGPVEDQDIDPIRAGGIVSRLVEPTETRARLFGREGAMIADSRALISAGRQVQLKYLAPPSEGNFITDAFLDAYDWVMPRLPSKERFPLYTERVDQRAEDYSETRGALAGEVGGAIRQDEDGGLIVSVAVPVQQLHIVLGAVMLTADSGDIEDSVRRVQAGIIQVFAVTLGVTVLMSMFLAGTIARPVKRLARAADQVRRWRGQRVEIPDLSHRRDEIGDLSGALREMTAALYARLDAIDAFAADVAHELKNPLTSLQSAVESLARTADPAQREKLFQVIVEDVRRLDRLITDISNASRVDAELSRAETETIDLAVLLETVVELHGTRLGASSPHLELRLPDGGPIRIEGVASRLGQVVDNLLSNAVSFSPPDGTIRLSLTRRGGMAEIAVEDEGPGLPEDWMDRLFERFYSARPEGEAFGRHSGLGLSIARQVVEAHGGTIVGENRLGGAGAIVGARFVVRLPL